MLRKILDHLRWYEPRIAVLWALITLAGWLAFDWSLLWPGLVALILMAIAVDSVIRPSSNWFITTISHGLRGERQVALSFDDGPDAIITPLVLDELKRHSARASFFVIGQALTQHPELGRRIVAEGHVIANHSWQHSYMQNFHLRRWQNEELKRCESSIEAITGRPSLRLYRPPVGMKTADQARAAMDLGLKVVAWSVHSRDTVAPDPTAIARRVLRKVRGGDIILLHDGDRVPGRRRTCPEALRLILIGLREKGLDCVTLTELLGPNP
jgi:peptidoglycan/xylan/chitin deacetylase (PgdA/CDA1 family)